MSHRKPHWPFSRNSYQVGVKCYAWSYIYTSWTLSWNSASYCKIVVWSVGYGKDPKCDPILQHDYEVPPGVLYYGLQKCSTWTVGKAVEDCYLFSKTLNNLLDEAHPEVERLTTNKENRDFLMMHWRLSCWGSMLGVDTSWCKKVATQKKRLEQEGWQLLRAVVVHATNAITAELKSSSSLGFIRT